MARPPHRRRPLRLRPEHGLSSRRRPAEADATLVGPVTEIPWAPTVTMVLTTPSRAAITRARNDRVAPTDPVTGLAPRSLARSRAETRTSSSTTESSTCARIRSAGFVGTLAVTCPGYRGPGRISCRRAAVHILRCCTGNSHRYLTQVGDGGSTKYRCATASGPGTDRPAQALVEIPGVDPRCRPLSGGSYPRDDSPSDARHGCRYCPAGE